MRADLQLAERKIAQMMADDIRRRRRGLDAKAETTVSRNGVDMRLVDSDADGRVPARQGRHAKLRQELAVRAVHGIAAGILAAAATTIGPVSGSTPVVLPAAFVPPDYPKLAPRRGAAAHAACRIRVGEVRDLRADPQSMGNISGRPVRAEDAAGWVRSGLLSLARDTRLSLGDAPDPSEILLSTEILKAYMISITSDKAVTVVLRVRFARAGAADEQKIFRRRRHRRELELRRGGDARPVQPHPGAVDRRYRRRARRPLRRAPAGSGRRRA